MLDGGLGRTKWLDPSSNVCKSTGVSDVLKHPAGFYTGNEEVYLPSNVLFRMGGAALVMSTR